jgi:phosphocarrier protein
MIKDELGLHARPAGQLVKLAGQYAAEITLSCNGKTANAKKLFQVMGMGTKGGQNLTITIEGADEEAARAALEKFLNEND